MADHVLPDGREITFDLGAFSVSEWRKFVSGKATTAEDDAMLSKVSGLAVDEIQTLPYIDWRRLVKAFVRKTQEPLSDPN